MNTDFDNRKRKREEEEEDENEEIQSSSKKVKVTSNPRVFKPSPNISFDVLPAIKMNASTGEIYSDQASTPLQLHFISAHIQICGNFSKTTTFLKFYNEHSKVLEGELVFPLPEGVDISGYGLEIDGNIVDAVPCTKEKARVAFDTTVRERSGKVSIAEKVEAGTNVFKTRVYPMKPGQFKSVKVVVIRKLTFDDVNNCMYYFWNFEKSKYLKDVTIFYEKVQAEKILLKVGNSLRECNDIKKVTIKDGFDGVLIKIPQNNSDDKNSNDCIVQIEKETDESEVYFSATLKNLPKEITLKSNAKQIKSITAFVDVSNSRNVQTNSKYIREMELNVLLNILKQFKGPTLEIITFSCAIHTKNIIKNESELRKLFMQDIFYDGGTSLPINEISSCKSDMALLFTDGISNFGKDLEAQLRDTSFNVPIYAFSTTPKVSHLMLKFIYNCSGGKYFNIFAQNQSMDEIIKSIGSNSIVLLKGVKYKENEACEIIHQNHINEDNSITIYGKLKNVQSESTFLLDFGSFTKSIVITKEDLKKFHDRNINKNIDNSLVRILWAQKVIEKLSIFPKKNQEKIEQIGIKFGIVTEHTSLIVLDSLEQFKKYKIIPPKSLGKIRKLYMNEIFAEEQSKEKKEKNKIEIWAKRWKERINWHKKDFTPPEEEKKKEKDKLMENNILQSGSSQLSFNFNQNSFGASRSRGGGGSGGSGGRGRIGGRRNRSIGGMEEVEESMRSLDEIRDESPAPAMERSIAPLRRTKAKKKKRKKQAKSSLATKSISPPVPVPIPSQKLQQSLMLQKENESSEDDDEEDFSIAREEDNKKEKEKKGKKIATPKKVTSQIKVKAWSPDAKYMENIANIQSVNPQDKYLQYLKEKISFATSPAFYLDVGDYFLTQLKNIPMGVRILSNIMELELSNPQLFRCVGYRLGQAKLYFEAIEVFEKVLLLKPEEPQSYRDLGLLYEKIGNYEKASELLYHVIKGQWDSRFTQIELTAAVELCHVLWQVRNDSQRKEKIMKNIDKRFVFYFDLDVRISMAWDTDLTDIDLHVYDMYGEHCYYGHKTTKGGGLYNHDFTRGYGPEEFLQRVVHKSGNFKVTAKYFASHQQSLQGGTTILLNFFTNYMRENEKEGMVTIRLNKNKSEIKVCDIAFEK